MKGLGFGVEVYSLGCRVQCLAFRVEGSGSMV
jgi:hypothetical protein